MRDPVARSHWVRQVCAYGAAGVTANGLATADAGEEGRQMEMAGWARWPKSLGKHCLKINMTEHPR